MTRGIVFSPDAALFIGLLALSAVFLAHYVEIIADITSTHVRYESLREEAEHAVNMLLFADIPLRCHDGGIPVPGCVKNNSVDWNVFWPLGPRDCNVVASDPTVTNFLSSTLKCDKSIPADVNTLVIVPFKLCWSPGGDPTSCTWMDANLYAWGRG